MKMIHTVLVLLSDGVNMYFSNLALTCSTKLAKCSSVMHYTQAHMHDSTTSEFSSKEGHSTFSGNW